MAFGPAVVVSVRGWPVAWIAQADWRARFGVDRVGAAGGRD